MNTIYNINYKLILKVYSKAKEEIKPKRPTAFMNLLHLNLVYAPENVCLYNGHPEF